MTGIDIRNVTKRFDLDGRSLTALEGIDLSVPEGSFAALIGPSGCGKSTLLRLIADVFAPSEGAIAVGGRPPREARLSHEIGFVFQAATLLPWRTVRENVALPAEIAGVTPRRSAEALIDLVGLHGFENAKPAQLSGGMQQRVAIARALMLEPKVLLMDEPFGALDEITRQRMNVELLRIWRESGTTAVLVTHTISEAVFMADRVHVLSANPGRVTGVVDVDLPRPRDFGLMKTSRFNALENAVRQLLFDEEENGAAKARAHG
ncbi:ABC transporter ATP-binding protein [Roseibacterium sp. SDUM158016]|uniref:ABC transporter ATP-binding protein n=1 Tax=Roseicyclus sediminis TaxID=2980997 RepID=UPI0021D05AAA|nr:ABC transporter ATP-binding protein [Roseibacterium sp. SDUM158016]MCU4651794.1 ABC transporter ATP-binding protein [Roseibacterium sp. SDUM158016]